MTLDNEKKDEFVEFIKESLLDIIYFSIYEELRSYRDVENDRNWYDGITLLELPVDETSLTTTAISQTTKIIKLTTYATSGTFATPNFREKFDPNKFSLFAKFKLVIRIPSSVFKSNSVQLILEIVYDAIGRHDSRNYETVEITSSSIEELQNSNERIVRKISLNRRSVYIEFTRSLTQEEVENWNARRMTGMNVSWYYSSPSVQPERKFVEQQGNSYFRKIVSLVHQHYYQSEDSLWRAAKSAKMKQDLDYCYGNLFTSTMYGETSLLKQISENLGVTNITVNNSSEEISDKTMELATKIYTYLVNCPKDYWYYWDVWINFYTDIFRKYKVRTILLTLSRIITVSREKDRMEFELSMRLFRKLSDTFNLPGGEFSLSDPGRSRE